MRNTLKKVMGAVMIVALLVGVLTVTSEDAQAASKNYMKGLKLKWDLKKNKTVKFNVAMNVLKKITIQAKITNYKIVNAKKAGYKKLSFTVTCKDNYKKPSNNQIHKIAKAGIQAGNNWFSVADFNTGLSLEKKNEFDVTVKSSGWKVIKKKRYKDNHNCYIEAITQRTNVSITYPEEYDGLCIGVGGQNQLGDSTMDRRYWSGKVKFDKTSYYKKGKKNSHWMRVRASKKKQPTATGKPQSAKTPVPTASPSGNVLGGTDGNTPTPTAPTPTSSPSGSTPTPTASPDGEVRTIIYDSQALDSECWKAVWDAEKKGEPYHLVLTDGFACDGFSHMVKVTLPDNLTKIADGEFLGCSSLTEITIPDSVTSIGESAFGGCSSLTSMIIPEGVTSIEYGSIFANCDSLTTITVSEKNAVYDSRDNCNAIIKTDTNALIAGSNSTVIPETVTSIGEAAFAGCNNLTSITIPEGVKSIGNGAFSGCKSLESITIPEGVTSIGQWAFSDCGVWKSEGGESRFIASLVSVTIPDSVTSIGEGAFQRAMNITWKGTTYTNVDSFEEAFGGFGKNDD